MQSALEEVVNLKEDQAMILDLGPDERRARDAATVLVQALPEGERGVVVVGGGRASKVANCDLLQQKWRSQTVTSHLRCQIGTSRGKEIRMEPASLLIPAERIEQAIVLLRGEKGIRDRDLAALYGVSTRVFNQAVKRNRTRFPEDFMFQLTASEHDALRSQSVTLKTGRGKHRKYLPYAFTEHGVAMLSSVLRSKRAVAVNIEIMRAFIRLRRLLATHKDLAHNLEELEKKYDSQFQLVFEAIRQLMEPPAHPKPGRIGFGREPDA